jgi:hypothetical protein
MLLAGFRQNLTAGPSGNVFMATENRHPNSASPAWEPKVNPWLTASAVMLATFMEVLDTSVANVSLAHIAGSVSASYDEATWVLTS